MAGGHQQAWGLTKDLDVSAQLLPLGAISHPVQFRPWAQDMGITLDAVQTRAVMLRGAL